MAATLQQDLQPSGVNQGDLVAVLQNMRDLVNEIKTNYTALLADVTATRAEVVKLVTDMGTRISNFNTLATKLNADAGVTDTNYAAAGAITAAAPAALTAIALTSSAVSLAKG